MAMADPVATKISLNIINDENHKGKCLFNVKTSKVERKKSLSAKGSKHVPKDVIKFSFRAKYPSRRSVKAAAIKTKKAEKYKSLNIKTDKKGIAATLDAVRMFGRLIMCIAHILLIISFAKPEQDTSLAPSICLARS